MKRIFALYIITLSIVLLFVHNAIPHAHRKVDIGNVILNELAENYLDKLKKVFLIDLGQDHLSNYKQKKNLSLNFDLDINVNYPFNVKETFSIENLLFKSIQLPIIIPFYQQPQIGKDRKRGPPQII